jgi:hypothetical protein
MACLQVQLFVWYVLRVAWCVGGRGFLLGGGVMGGVPGDVGAGLADIKVQTARLAILPYRAVYGRGARI